MVSPTTDRRYGVVGSRAFKVPVTVIATANVTLAGEQIIDSVALLASNLAGLPDRVLLTAQSTASENGIWDVSATAWTRSIDANGQYDFVRGTQVVASRGTLRAGQTWWLTTAEPYTIGTTALTWALLAGGDGGSPATVINNITERVEVLEEPIDFDRKVASYTLVATDCDVAGPLKWIEMNVGSANDLTIPLNATVALPLGRPIFFSQFGAGTTTVVATGGVTALSDSLELRAQYSCGGMIQVATDVWYVWGDMAP